MSDPKETWVPMHHVFGQGKVPVTSAKVVRDAIDEMRRRGDLGAEAPIWQGIEYLAADYLAGYGRKGDQ